MYRFLITLYLLLLTFGTKAQQIGFLLDDFNVDRWYTDRDAFLARCEELGTEAVVKVAYSDAKAQLEQGMELLDAGAKVLVIVPTDGRILRPLVNEAHKRGAKVIAYDRMIIDAPIDYYVSYDNEKVGELMAEYMLQQKPKGTYAIVSGPDTDANSALFYKGQMKVLQPAIDRGDIKIAFDEKVGEWTEMEAMLITDNQLGTYKGKINVILAANDGLASGVLVALDSHGKDKVLVSGQDADKSACRLIREGRQAMSVYKPVKPLAQQAAELAVKLANNNKVKHTHTVSNNYGEIPAFLAQPVVVHQGNLNETVVADGHLEVADLQ